jgi:hypothetical protein
MAGKSAAFENDILNLVFNKVSIPNIADYPAGATSDLWLSLHTASPEGTGSQSANEISYTGYARIFLHRQAGDFDITGSTVAFNAGMNFLKMTGGTGGTATHLGVGLSSTGAGYLLYVLNLSPPIVVSTGVQPRINIGATMTET